MKEYTKLLQFGCPKIQHFYQKLCWDSGVDFEDFKSKLVEDTEIPYFELKECWTEGEEVFLSAEEEDQLYYVEIPKRLIVSFDPQTKEIVGMIPQSYEVLTDRWNYYLENL